MGAKQLTLELAAFLDSSAARALTSPGRALQRQIAQALLETCYGELGIKPRLLDGDSIEQLIAQRLPQRFQTTYLPSQLL